MTEQEFIEEIKKLGITPTKDKLQKLEKFYQLLIEWNKKINLTRITNKEEVYLKHFYDSLTIVKEVDLTKVNTLCDVGTGAGISEEETPKITNSSQTEIHPRFTACATAQR